MDVGRRPDVFTGMPYAIYMPRNTEFEIEALTDDFAMASCWASTDQDHKVKLITPKESQTQIHGGGTATYQVNTIIEPGFDCHRLTAREIYTPGGNWSHYPPHKHDTHTEKNGTVSEAALEEIFFYKHDKPNGFSVQRIYDDNEIDATITAKHNDVVIVPKGYHTMSSAHGFTTLQPESSPQGQRNHSHIQSTPVLLGSLKLGQTKTLVCQLFIVVWSHMTTRLQKPDSIAHLISL